MHLLFLQNGVEKSFDDDKKTWKMVPHGELLVCRYNKATADGVVFSNLKLNWKGFFFHSFKSGVPSEKGPFLTIY